MRSSGLALSPGALRPLWTWRDVATYLGVKRSWVYARAADGTLPSVRPAGLLRFVPEEVRAWAEAAASGSVVSVGPRR